MTIPNIFSSKHPQDASAPYLNALLSGSSDGILFISPDYKVEFANEETVRMGILAQIKPGSELNSVFPGLLGETDRIFEEVRCTGESIKIDLNPYKFKKSSKQSPSYWNATITPVQKEDGFFLGWFLLLHDSTENRESDLEKDTWLAAKPVSNEKKVVKDVHQTESHLHQLEAVIESMEDGVVIFTLDGKILKINNAAVQIMGFHNLEKCPDNIFNIPTDFKLYDLEGNMIAVEEWPSNRIVRGQTVHNYEVAVWRSKIGQIRYLSFNGTLIQDSNQMRTLGVLTIRDISERESLLRELEQEHSRLQAVLEQMPCGVIMFDACSLKQILANKKYTEIWQVPKAGLELSDNYQPGKMFHSDGRLYNKEELPIFRSINNGEVVSNEEMICQRKNGSIVTVICNSTPILDRDGNIVAGVIVFSDITELKEATAKATIANQLQQIIEFLPDGIFVVDQERKVTAWNRALEILTGVPQQKVIGSKAENLFDGFERLTLVDGIFNGSVPDNDPTLKKSGDVFSKQVLLPSLNFRDNVLLDIKATPIRNKQGIILGIIEIVRDITHQREMEMEAIRMQKLESLGILAGGIAHDFNNILAAIVANLQLAAVKLQKRQDISTYLENTIETTRKASGLTKQLLTFAKGGEPVKKMLILSKLIRETVNFALCGSKTKAVFRLPENLWTVKADESQITQVINNLIINAEQAMPDGGRIDIYGENVICDSNSKYEPGRYVKIAVTDHGLGIPEEIINQIFDPFFTTKKIGSGLGLSTSYSIIKKHNGYIEVESSSETGTTLSILLPASVEDFIDKETPRDINVSINAKVLLLDDEDVIRNVSGELLSVFGYRVVLARDGQEAIDLYQEAYKIGDPFLAVIMDLTIPGGMGGLETMNILRRFDPEIRAIVSSGYANDPVISDYERYGFCGVVVKPYRFDDLLAELDRIIEKRQLPLNLEY